MDAQTLLVVGTAVAAPSLMQAGARAGVPIPAHVTPAQTAALAELDRAGMAGADAAGSGMTWHRTKVYENAQPLTAARARALCDAALAACRAGVLVNDPTQYELTAGQRFESFDTRQAVWNALRTSDGRDLTSLGRAAAQVMARLDGVASGFLSTAHDLASVAHSVGLLCIEMDDVGHLIGGKPATLGDELSGGLSAAGAATSKFLAERTSEAALAAARAVADLVLGSPVLFAAVGLVAWKVLR